MNILMARIFWVFAIKSLKMKLAKKTNIFQKGFTLAMVTVVPKIQDAQNKTAFKTEYSVMAQVTSRIVGDNGNSLKGVFPDDNTMKDKFKEYLNTIKSCDAGQALGNCWHNNDGSSKYLNGNPVTTWSNIPSLILNNGVLINFWTANSNCTALSGTVLFCGRISIDVNGFKGPNTYGKDIYFIWIQETGIKSLGTKGDAYESQCTASSNGGGCAAKVLKGEDY
ncbi:MAG: hypothetical protein V2B14_00125 [bacterium]